MAITGNPRSKKTGRKVQEFVEGAAAQGADYDKGTKKGNKRQISLTIDPELLRWLDDTAKEFGTSRAGVISTLVAKAREKGYLN